MKYYINIDQSFALKHQLTLSEASVLDYILHLPAWADKAVLSGDVWYFAARQNACNELPLVTQKPDTMYRHYKSLEQKGLIKLMKVQKKDYVLITELCKEVGRTSEQSEKNPSEFGNKSENNSEIFPTYNNTKEEKNTNENTAGKEPAKPKSDYTIAVEKWFAFCEQKNHVKPQFDGASGKAMKAVLKYLAQIKNEDKTVIETFEYILQHWQQLDKWVQVNALDIKVFNSKINSIIAQLNPKQNGQENTVGQSIEREVFERLNTERNQEQQSI